MEGIDTFIFPDSQRPRTVMYVASRRNRTCFGTATAGTPHRDATAGVVG